MGFETYNPRQGVERMTVDSYESLSRQQKIGFLNKLIERTKARSLPDHSVKNIFEMLQGKSYPGRNNFLARRMYFNRNMRGAIRQNTLSRVKPYWDARTKNYTYDITRPFRGTATQNRCLIHFLASKAKEKLSKAHRRATVMSNARNRRIKLAKEARERVYVDPTIRLEHLGKRFRAIASRIDRGTSSNEHTRAEKRLFDDLSRFIERTDFDQLPIQTRAKTHLAHVYLGTHLAAKAMYDDPSQESGLRGTQKIKKAYEILLGVGKSSKGIAQISPRVNSALRLQLRTYNAIYRKHLKVCLRELF